MHHNGIVPSEQTMSELKKFVGAVALVRQVRDGRTMWLARRDQSTGRYGFVEADRLEGESYRESIDREVAWTLGLKRGKDYIVSSTPRLHLELQAQPPGETESMWFIVEFYVVDLFGSSAGETIQADPDNRWLSAEELHQGKAADGTPLSERMTMLLSKSDVIPPWDE